MKKDLSTGEQMIRLKFNPSGDGNVNLAKTMFAEAINKVENMQLEMLQKADSIEDSEEKLLTIEEINRNMDFAKSYIQSASFHTVFAITSLS